MTLKVSWYLAMMRRMFQEVLAMSSPSGCKTSLAMSIKSMPTHSQIATEVTVYRSYYWYIAMFGILLAQPIDKQHSVQPETIVSFWET